MSEQQQTATYIDENGEKKTGLYAQAAAEAESGTGENAGLGAGSGSGSTGYYDRMNTYYKNMYDEQVAANNAALANARQRAQETADASIGALNTGYQQTNKQLYRDYMQDQRTLPQQMAAQGYSGGLSESARLRLGTAYGEALSANEQARLAQINAYNQTLAQQQYEAQAAADAANLQASQNLYGYQAQLQQAQYQELQQQADNMAAAGDFSTYLQLGYSQDQVDYLTRQWIKLNPTLKDTWITAHPEEAARLGIKKTGGGGGGTSYYYGGSSSGSGGEEPSPTGGLTPEQDAALRNYAAAQQSLMRTSPSSAQSIASQPAAQLSAIKPAAASMAAAIRNTAGTAASAAKK